MKWFTILIVFAVALTAWGRNIGRILDHSYDAYDYGTYGVASTVQFKPSYSTSKPIIVNAVKPVYGFKPYYGYGSAYGYGYKPSYSTYKPYYIYRPQWGYNPYGYGSSYLSGYNPYYYGSYKHGLPGHTLDYIDW